MQIRRKENGVKKREGGTRAYMCLLVLLSHPRPCPAQTTIHLQLPPSKTLVLPTLPSSLPVTLSTPPHPPLPFPTPFAENNNVMAETAVPEPLE